MNSITRSLFLISVAVLLGACAHDINKYNADRYYELGLRAEFAGDFATAKEAYRRALINGRSGRSPQAGISAAMYSYGRMVGYTCDFPEAEKLLVEALSLEETLPGPDRRNVTKRLSELARLSFDLEKFQESASYYERAIPIMDAVMLSEDSIGYALYLNDYAQALDRIGEVRKSNEVRKRIAEIREVKHYVKSI